MSPQAIALLDSILSYNYISSNVHAIQESSYKSNLPFAYTTSIGTLESIVLSGLQRITGYRPFLNFLSNYSELSNPYISEGMTYNFTSQNYGIYVMPLVSEGQNQTTFMFAYSSSNGTVYGPSLSTVQVTPLSKYVYQANWAGYDFYESSHTGIKYAESSINVPTIYRPSNPEKGDNIGVSGWVGISPYVGAAAPNGGTVVAQAYWQAEFEYNDFNGSWDSATYSMSTQTWNGSHLYEQNFPGISPSVSPGWACQFTVGGNANGSVTYSVINNNGNSFLTTPAGSYIYATNSSYSEFIAETPGIWQLAKYSPSIYFNGSEIEDVNSYTYYLNTFYNSGYYDEYIMNNTSGSDLNIIDHFITSQYSGEPVMQYNNSDY